MPSATARNELDEPVRPSSGREAVGRGPGVESPRPAPGAPTLPGFDPAEHEVRSLLHLASLISYCLQHCEATEVERGEWRREAVQANERLARLRAAGWCSGLLQ